WSLSTHGLSAAVGYTARRCKDLALPLLILGGGGYDDVNAARTFGACTVAACEGVRPGVLGRLPRGAPEGEFFHRYSPSFELHTARTERGTYGGTDVGRGRRRVEGGMEDARGVVEGWRRIVEGKVDGGFRYEEEVGGGRGEKEGDENKEGVENKVGGEGVEGEEGVEKTKPQDADATTTTTTTSITTSPSKNVVHDDDILLPPLGGGSPTILTEQN
ncbi:hypothetical protein TrRE_jg9453, partial [Triparma retinervis]